MKSRSACLCRRRRSLVCRAIASPPRMSQKKESITFVILSFAWCHQESNRGHKDFQSFALPTELWHLAFVCECKGIANFITVQIFLIKFLRINEGEIAKKAVSQRDAAFSLMFGGFYFFKITLVVVTFSPETTRTMYTPSGFPAMSIVLSLPKRATTAPATLSTSTRS